MVNGIIDGISIELNLKFGDSYKIYSEDVSQGLKEPCFFIAVLNPSQKYLLNTKRQRNNLFDIHYFPTKQGGNSEIEDVAESLYSTLEWINVDGNDIRGTKMHHNSVDGVLHFFVEYNFFINKIVTPEDKMESVKVNNNVKE
jgi:hypothetical protein